MKYISDQSEICSFVFFSLMVIQDKIPAEFSPVVFVFNVKDNIYLRQFFFDKIKRLSTLKPPKITSHKLKINIEKILVAR